MTEGKLISYLQAVNIVNLEIPQSQQKGVMYK